MSALLGLDAKALETSNTTTNINTTISDVAPMPGESFVGFVCKISEQLVTMIRNYNKSLDARGPKNDMPGILSAIFHISLVYKL